MLVVKSLLRLKTNKQKEVYPTHAHSHETLQLELDSQNWQEDDTVSAQIQTHASHKQGGGDLVLQDLESYHFVGKPPPVCKDEEDYDG